MSARVGDDVIADVRERTSIVEMQRGMFLNSAVPISNRAAVPVS